MTVNFTLNGKKTTANVPVGTVLIDLLRKKYDLAAAKDNCRCGVCGHCTVLINGQPVMACQTPVFAVHKKKILTFEGFSQLDEFNEYMGALRKEHVRLCEFCMPAKVLNSVLLPVLGLPISAMVYGVWSGVG